MHGAEKSSRSYPRRSATGSASSQGHEYVRNGTANIFMFVDVNRPWRHAKITDQRTGADFAEHSRPRRQARYRRRIADRTGSGPDTTYDIVVSAVDQSGNVGAHTIAVTIPHNGPTKECLSQSKIVRDAQ
jgi:hypothetical protein